MLTTLLLIAAVATNPVIAIGMTAAIAAVTYRKKQFLFVAPVAVVAAVTAATVVATRLTAAAIASSAASAAPAVASTAASWNYCYCC